MNRIIKYVKEAIKELKKVVWPDRKQTTSQTIMVIAVSLLVAAFLGVIDFFLNRALNLII